MEYFYFLNLLFSIIHFYFLSLIFFILYPFLSLSLYISPLFLYFFKLLTIFCVIRTLSLSLALSLFYYLSPSRSLSFYPSLSLSLNSLNLSMFLKTHKFIWHTIYLFRSSLLHLYFFLLYLSLKSFLSFVQASQNFGCKNT